MQRKRSGKNAGMLQVSQPVTICDQFICLILRQLESEPFRKTLNVAIDSSVINGLLRSSQITDSTMRSELMTRSGNGGKAKKEFKEKCSVWE